MPKKFYLTQADAVVKYATLITNAKTHPEISQILSEFGYDSAKIKEGEDLLTKTQNAIKASGQEYKEKQLAYRDFQDKYKALLDSYSLDRKKAHIIFRKDNQVKKSLHISGSKMASLSKHVEMMKIFYGILSENQDIAKPLEKLKITAEHISSQKAKVAELEAAVAKYKAEKGENEQATLERKEAFDELRAWVGEFYAVAKIALSDKPQLIEALNKKA